MSSEERGYFSEEHFPEYNENAERWHVPTHFLKVHFQHMFSELSNPFSGRSGMHFQHWLLLDS
jgi:hypothetical protein